jgi:hypothetical protein
MDSVRTVIILSGGQHWAREPLRFAYWLTQY